MICSVGIAAYNEERNIAALLDSLRRQRLLHSRLADVVVIMSGCTDRTAEIVRAKAQDWPLLRGIEEPARLGKASAVNTLLQVTDAPILVLANADTLVAPDAIERLLAPFADPSVGMTGGRVVPLNDRRSLLGFSSHVIWNLHHAMNLHGRVKLGEFVAVHKRAVPFVATDTPVDEVSMEAAVAASGFLRVYVPEAVLHIHGPETIRDYLAQRRRIFCGHLWARASYGWSVPTLSASLPLRLLWTMYRRHELVQSWQDPVRLLGTVSLEGFSRMLGGIDYVAGRDHHIWTVATTTKYLSPESQRSNLSR